ncbi:MAG: response regulator transcription factor [Spirochaetales bacterium]|nr:response regulator transcription factor [Spirochaetales bacterium]MCF7938009.1 response regulator transcription factor [Spirochaetales bacterium]
MTKIVLVEDHPIVRQGIARLIEREDDLTVCGEAEEAGRALELLDECRPDLAVVDLSLKESSGLELIKDLHIRMPDLLILVVSLHDERLYAERVIRSGARGYVMKDEATERILEAIRVVLSGDIYVSEPIRKQLLRKQLQPEAEKSGQVYDLLSDRELEIFRLIGEGCDTKTIAERLALSAKTVDTYKSHLKQKLHLESSTELIHRAVNWLIQERGGGS